MYDKRRAGDSVESGVMPSTLSFILFYFTFRKDGYGIYIDGSIIGKIDDKVLCICIGADIAFQLYQVCWKCRSAIYPARKKPRTLLNIGVNCPQCQVAAALRKDLGLSLPQRCCCCGLLPTVRHRGSRLCRPGIRTAPGNGGAPLPSKMRTLSIRIGPVMPAPPVERRIGCRGG